MALEIARVAVHRDCHGKICCTLYGPGFFGCEDMEEVELCFAREDKPLELLTTVPLMIDNGDRRLEEKFRDFLTNLDDLLLPDVSIGVVLALLVQETFEAATQIEQEKMKKQGLFTTQAE